MSETSPILSLPYLMPSQAQKHVTHNEALQILDVLVQLRLAAFDADTPPADPAPGDAYGLGGAPTGAWAAQPGAIAVWQGEGWQFLTPQTGWRAWGLAEQTLRVWDGSAWVLPPLEGDTLPRLGVNTSADATNRLAVAAQATLLSHDGAGHQLKINKAGSTDTGALLFQSNWTGRAEMGLLGNSDFSIKVSADGSAWTEALRIDSASGDTGFGTGSPTCRLHASESQNTQTARFENTHAAFSGTVQNIMTERSASAAFNFIRCLSSAGGSSDLAFRITGDGQVLADGAFTGGGADYAEYFEWADGNPGGADRRGVAVVLEGEKIRPARADEDPIGVVSARPSVLGDGDAGGWTGKYLRDDFGTCLRDESDSARTRRLNPAFEAARAYVPRAERAEWAMVGLIGKLRLRKGQPVGGRWLWLRAVSDEVGEWLVR